MNVTRYNNNPALADMHKDVINLAKDLPPIQYEFNYVERTSIEAVKVFALRLFTLGIWRIYKEKELNKSLIKGDIRGAELLIREGAPHTISAKKIVNLVRLGRLDSALFMVRQIGTNDKAYELSDPIQQDFMQLNNEIQDYTENEKAQLKNYAQYLVKLSKITYRPGDGAYRPYSKIYRKYGIPISENTVYDSYRLHVLVHHAVTSLDREKVRILQKEHIPFKFWNVQGGGIYFQIYSSSEIKTLTQFLVNDCGFDINEIILFDKSKSRKRFSEITPLESAWVYGDLEVFKWLIEEKKANPNLCFSEDVIHEFSQANNCFPYILNSPLFAPIIKRDCRKALKENNMALALCFDGYLPQDLQDVIDAYKKQNLCWTTIPTKNSSNLINPPYT